jgi:ubiquinone/menaquinone biosynthesis C-methylase UbiE
MLRRMLRFFFYNFYHTFAWTYDFIATMVSMGRWNAWIQTVIPYIYGNSVLELGHGPGHLQKLLMSENRLIVGLDESTQMGRLTKRRLEKAGYFKRNLTRAIAESLPFADETFSTVVSTFPTEYIFKLETLSAIHRVLKKNGKFIVLPSAWITGQKLLDKCTAWLFKITGQSPAEAQAVVIDRINKIFEASGFNSEFKTIETKSSTVLLVISCKLNGL